MNLIEQIDGQLTPDSLAGLAGLLGLNAADTAKAVSAAVPALLASLTALVRMPSGAERVLSAVRAHEHGPAADLRAILAGDPPSAADEPAGGVVGSLLGAGGFTALVGALAKYAAVHPDGLRKLLAYLGPYVLSTVFGELRSREVSAAALTGLLDENEPAVRNALPAGFVLPDPTRLAGAAGGVAVATHRRRWPRWLVAVVLLSALGGAALWMLMNQGQTNPPVDETVPVSTPSPTADTTRAAPNPDAAALSRSLEDAYGAATRDLTDVKDAAGAETALPKLQALNSTLDTLKAGWDKLPESARASVRAVGTEKLPRLKELAARVSEAPGVSEKFRLAVDALIAKLSALN